MIRVPTLTYYMPLSLVRRDFVYTLCRIRRLDHMKTFVAPMEAQLEGINAAIKTETSLLDAIENARAAFQRLARRPPRDIIIERRTDHTLDAGKCIARRIAAGSARPIEHQLYRRAGARIIRRIEARTTDQHVGPRSARQRVVARAAVERICTRAARQRIVAEAAFEDLVRRAAGEAVGIIGADQALDIDRKSVV